MIRSRATGYRKKNGKAEGRRRGRATGRPAHARCHIYLFRTRAHTTARMERRGGGARAAYAYPRGMIVFQIYFYPFHSPASSPRPYASQKRPSTEVCECMWLCRPTALGPSSPLVYPPPLPPPPAPAPRPTFLLQSSSSSRTRSSPTLGFECRSCSNFETHPTRRPLFSLGRESHTNSAVLVNSARKNRSASIPRPRPNPTCTRPSPKVGAL